MNGMKRETIFLVFQVLKDAAEPTESWGPALATNRTGRYAPDYEIGISTTGNSDIGWTYPDSIKLNGIKLTDSSTSLNKASHDNEAFVDNSKF